MAPDSAKGLPAMIHTSRYPHAQVPHQLPTDNPNGAGIPSNTRLIARTRGDAWS
jgi:hypothetical protein